MNIYIVGVPRTGKSSLASLVKSEIPSFNIISFEAIRNGFIKSLPDLNMGNRESKARKEVLPEFILEFLNWNKTILNVNNVIEGDFISVESLHEKKSNDDLIICLGFGKRSIDEIYDNVNKYSKEYDYTYNWDIGEFKKHFYDLEEKDTQNYNYCKENKILYYDTFNNREEILNNIIEVIKKSI